MSKYRCGNCEVEVEYRTDRCPFCRLWLDFSLTYHNGSAGVKYVHGFEEEETRSKS